MKELDLHEKREVLYDDKTKTYYKRLSDKLQYKKITVDSYYCKPSGSLDNVQTIGATYDYEKDFGELISLCLCDTTGLLTSLLTLTSKLQEVFKNTNVVRDNKLAKFRKLSSEEQIQKQVEEDPEYFEKMAYFTYPKKIFEFYNDIPEAAVNLIISWCKRNGFPFMPLVEKKRKNRPLLKEYKPKNHISFLVPEFLYELYKLYTAFRLYEKIVGITEHGDHNASIFIPVESANKLIPFFKTKTIGEMTIEECQQYFAGMYEERQYSCYVEFCDGKSYTTIIANSVFDAAYYQLVMLLNDCGTRLIKCPLCHDFFEPSHARQKYCGNPYCNPQAAYKDKMRTEQRAKEKAVK